VLKPHPSNLPGEEWPLTYKKLIRRTRILPFKDKSFYLGGYNFLLALITPWPNFTLLGSLLVRRNFKDNKEVGIP